MKQSKDNKASDIVQSELLMKFFKKNPNRDVPHPEIVDWVTAEYLKRTGKVFRFAIDKKFMVDGSAAAKDYWQIKDFKEAFN